MHHLVINIPDGMFCDHINHNGLDNRRANLRPVTLTQNVWNRRKFKKPSRSKYKGVDWSTEMKRWRARIRVNGKRIYLGSFKHEIEAAKAYDTAAAKYHGQFAALNFKRRSQPHVKHEERRQRMDDSGRSRAIAPRFLTQPR